MPALRDVVRYGYAPFMMLGLTGVAYWIVAELAIAQNNPWAYLWLAPLLALAYATAFAAETHRAVLRRVERSRRARRYADQRPAHPRLRDAEHQRRAAHPAHRLAVSVPGNLADRVAAVGAVARRLRHLRLHLHDDALPQPQVCAAVAAACGASRRRSPLRHERRDAPSAAPGHRHDHRQRAAGASWACRSRSRCCSASSSR